MRKLILNGHELENSYAIKSGYRLLLYVYADISFADLFAILNDPMNVLTVVVEENGVQTTFDGFSEFYTITKEEEGFISAGLRKPL